MSDMRDIVQSLFTESAELNGNLVMMHSQAADLNQKLTNDAFSEKWKDAAEKDVMTGEGLEFQRNWYLDLYGFKSFDDLKEFLSDKKVILDAGCGLGYKAAMFAELSPNSIVIGMDFSDAVLIAKDTYKHLPNLFFVKGDIANTNLKHDSIDYVSCDQVLHHTTDPVKTFRHLCDITSKNGEFATYVYAKKALPRELLDDYFRTNVKDHSNEEIWAMSKQLTELGKVLADLKITINCPDIPLLGIKGGEQDLQRFIYWNFIKCFWNDKLGYEYSLSTNFDWYIPTNAFRYTEEEFRDMINSNSLEILYFHIEEACYSGRFKKAI
jgi:SAM-dependent methyltransferase